MTDLVKLDLGCGKTEVEEGIIGVDLYPWTDRVAVVVDLARCKWPWKDNVVDEVVSRNLLNYFTMAERTHAVNELYRVLKPGAKATFMVPHWSSHKAYGDPLVRMPPITEEWLFFLKREWREANAYWIDKCFSCDFDFTCGYGMHPHLFTKNVEYQQHALTFFKEAAQELIFTLIKRKE